MSTNRKIGSKAYNKEGAYLGIYRGSDKGYHIIEDKSNIYLYACDLYPPINSYYISLTDPKFYKLLNIFGSSKEVHWDAVVTKNTWKYLVIDVIPDIGSIYVSATNDDECKINRTLVSYEEAILILAGARE